MKDNKERQDNTAIPKPIIPERIKQTPRQYQLVDLGGEPSTDVRTSAQRNKDYLHPIKGAKDRFKESMHNGTNPLVGVERTILPSLAGAALVTTPIAMAKGAGYGYLTDKATGGWGDFVENTTGIPSEVGVYTNPGAIIGGAAGYKLDQKGLLSKFIKGDADLGWSPLSRSHWIFNKQARTPTNIAMASLNRVTPFLQGMEKTPLRGIAYGIGKRTKGNASVSLKDIKSNESSYTGASTPDGNSGRNLLGLYIFKNDPLVSRTPWFRNITQSFKPASGKGFSYSERYSELYPGVENRRYKMESVVRDGRPLKFRNMDEFAEYNKGIGQLQGKEGDMVINTGNGYQTFRQPGTNYAGPIDDVGGHVVKIDYNKNGKLVQTSQDIWKFNPKDYAKRWSGDSLSEGVRATKQAALMDKVGTPFILQQTNPIVIGGNRVWQSLDRIPSILRERRVPKMQAGLLTLKPGGKFTFNENKLVKNAKRISGRDMRRKVVKSDRPTYSNRRVKKGANGLRFAYYDAVDNPELDFSNYKIPNRILSPYNIPIPEEEKPESTPTEEATKPVVEPPVNEDPIIDDTPTDETWTSPYKKKKSQWVADLTGAYRRAGIKNDNALKLLLAQDALETTWGASAQGKYNFGNLTTGSAWKGKFTIGRDKNEKGEPIKQKFRAYNSMDEYAKDKIQFLRKLYDFDENDDINTFANKLTGANKGKRKYAASPTYKKLITDVFNSIK